MMLDQLVKCIVFADLALREAVIVRGDNCAVDMTALLRYSETAFGPVNNQDVAELSRHLLEAVNRYGKSPCVAFELAHLTYHLVYETDGRKH